MKRLLVLILCVFLFSCANPIEVKFIDDVTIVERYSKGEVVDVEKFKDIDGFLGLYYDENYETDFPYVWEFYKGNWYDGAEIYRKWLYKNLPYGLDFIKNNKALPQWYKNMPLVVIYMYLYPTALAYAITLTN